MPDPSMWQKIKEALPEQGDILKGISHVQEAGETAKLLWQIANYNPQYKIETQGDTHLRMPRGGGYYY